MTLKTIPFDAAKYLTDEQAQVELLSDALSTGHAAYIKNALNTIARARGVQMCRRLDINS